VALWNRFDYTGPGSSTGNTSLDPRYPLFYGLRAAAGPMEATAINNLVGLHELDFQGLPDVGNQIIFTEAELGDLFAQLTGDLPWSAFAGLGEVGSELTNTKGQGEADRVPVEDARYFTDWFGRSGLFEVVYIAGQEAQVVGVDYSAHQLQLDRKVKWAAGDPIYWCSPNPKMGLQGAYAPPTPQPETETVRLVLKAELTPTEAEQLRTLMAGKEITVGWA
jgi:hypothetical protein